MPLYLFTLIPALCLLLSFAGMFVYFKRQQRQDRRSPLVDDLLRLPGETLNERYRDAIFDLCEKFAAAAILPLTWACSHRRSASAGCRASPEGFPRGAWEPSTKLIQDKHRIYQNQTSARSNSYNPQLDDSHENTVDTHREL